MRLFLLLVCLVPILSFAQTKRALFLGNSYTGVNNLPQLTATLASSAGDTLIYDSNTPGGFTFQGHSTNTTSLNKIAQGNWDFVVLQEQSQRPSFPASQVEVEVFPYAQSLDSLIQLSNPCTETVFYMTWGRKNGDAGNCAVWPPVCTYDGMDSLLNLRYRMMADSNDAIVSPVGATWNFIRHNYPGIELYSPDESHPSLAGSYAAACCFYTVLFRKDPSLITATAGVDSTKAAQIRMATKAVVYDSLSKWNVGKYDVQADFDFNVQNPPTYYFRNLSTNEDTVFWIIEDSVFTGDSLFYDFPDERAFYPIQLIAIRGCDTSIKTDTLSVYMGTETVLNSLKIQLSPNPTKDLISFTVESDAEFNFQVSDMSGTKIKVGRIRNGEQIDLSSFPSGHYLISFSSDRGRKTLFVRKD